jgi:hypothetical protein
MNSFKLTTSTSEEQQEISEDGFDERCTRRKDTLDAEEITINKKRNLKESR